MGRIGWLFVSIYTGAAPFGHIQGGFRADMGYVD